MATAAEQLAELVDFPPALNSHVEALTAAAHLPYPMEWDEDAKFIEASGPEVVGRILVKTLHPHLINREIGYLFRESMQSRGSVTLAKASKVGGKLEHFSNLDFLIEVNWEQWKVLGVRERVALIDHELSHFDVDAERDTPVILPHDLEEFTSIVRRWGAWRPAICHLVKAAEDYNQRDLFEEPVRPSEEGIEAVKAAVNGGKKQRATATAGK